MADSVRLDKWLWAIRFLKTRTQAADLCREGKVQVQGKPAKASTLVKAGDLVIARKNGFQFQLRVVVPEEKRMAAPLAKTCYEDLTPQEELLKFTAWFNAGKKGEFREPGTGRPTKRERRKLAEFKRLPE